MNVRWVRQEDQYGCSIAVLAMIAGLSYQQVRQELGFDGRLESSCGAAQVEWLKTQGYEATICYSRAANYDRRAEFIPQDRPYLLWLSIGDPQTWRHSVLQLPDGTVLDPEHPEPRRLADCAPLQMVQVVIPTTPRRVVLSAEEFAGLKQIIANPQPPTPEAVAAMQRYRAMKAEQR